VKIKPTYSGFPATFTFCELLGLACLAAAIAQHAWTSSSKALGWLVLLLVFLGGPILFLVLGEITIDDDAISSRNATGWRKACRRAAVDRVVLRYNTVVLEAADGRCLMKLSRVWTDRQLESVSTFLGVPLIGPRQGQRWLRNKQHGE